MEFIIETHVTEYGFINECIYTNQCNEFLKYKIYIGDKYPESLIEMVRVSDLFRLMKTIHKSILID